MPYLILSVMYAHTINQTEKYTLVSRNTGKVIIMHLFRLQDLLQKL